MKLAKYVAEFLAAHGARHIFIVTGGGAMHLNDAIGQEKRLRYVCCHHEQACAMAAEGYARVAGAPGFVCVTTGPGGINALNGVFGAWTDSIPMLVISGQVKRETCMVCCNKMNLRQLGDQEADIISMVKGITKYCVLVDDPDAIRFHLEKAFFLATSGRPGPCWLDIPIDVQAANIDPCTLRSFTPRYEDDKRHSISSDVYNLIYKKFADSKRPVILAGNGIRLSNGLGEFRSLIERVQIPVLTARSAVDIIETDHQLFCGRPGIDGERAGNFVVQNCDFLLCVGSRLGVRQTGYNFIDFARSAYKIQVDIDHNELDKDFVLIDLKICADAHEFIVGLNKSIPANYKPKNNAWLKWCKEKLEKFPVVPKMHTQSEKINPYNFVNELFLRLRSYDIVICGNGSAFIMPMQAAKIKKGQRLIFNSGCASMGYDLPAAIGAAFANNGNRIICIAGDGSIQMNIQELQTIVHHNLNIIIFVINNGGYISISQTQTNFFGREMGANANCGVTFPDIVKVAHAYGLFAQRIMAKTFEKDLDKILVQPGPALYEIAVDPSQQFEPRSSSRVEVDGRIVSAPLEDMFPFLSRDDFEKENLINQTSKHIKS